MYGCTGLATEPTKYNLLFKKPLTVCYQLATCFGTVGPLSRNFQQLLFFLYNYLTMEEGCQNMQQTDYRQFGVSY
jgi:hypothetical protein